jgi:hypothetical protein
VAAQRLTLSVDPATLHENPVHRALVLIKRLRAVGIPAVGAIALENVEHGTISISAPDLVTGEVLYSWIPDQ